MNYPTWAFFATVVGAFFLSLLSTTLSSPLSNYLEGVHCYVCQYAKKSDYKSTFSQKFCNAKDIRANPKRYLQRCGPGYACRVLQVFSSGSLISETRECANRGIQNRITEARYCRTHDCNKSPRHKGDAVKSGEEVTCRIVNAGHNATLIMKNNAGDVKAKKCPADSANKFYACKYERVWKDSLAYGNPSNYAGPTHNLGCVQIIKDFWKDDYQKSDFELVVKEKTCVNSFCNAELQSGAASARISLVAMSVAVFSALMAFK